MLFFQEMYEQPDYWVVSIQTGSDIFNIYVTAAKGAHCYFTDHNPLLFLHYVKNKNQTLMQWSLFSTV